MIQDNTAHRYFTALETFCFIRPTDFSVFKYQGRLAGVGGEDLPTIVVVAHYDAFGIAPVSVYEPLNVFV